MGSAVELGPVSAGGSGQPGVIRILCLHSFRTSARIFKQQLSRSNLYKELMELGAELVFMDAPHAADGAFPDDVHPYFTGPYFQWFTAKERKDGSVLFNERQLLASQAAVEAALREGAAQGRPFAGIMGFSQGSMFSAALVAAQRAGMALQDVPPLRFCVLIAGIPSRYPAHKRAFECGAVRCPSLHLIGMQDSLKKYNMELVDAFECPVVLLHPRGHVVPSLEGPQLEVLKAFIRSSAAADSAPSWTLTNNPAASATASTSTNGPAATATSVVSGPANGSTLSTPPPSFSTSLSSPPSVLRSSLVPMPSLPSPSHAQSLSSSTSSSSPSAPSSSVQAAATAAPWSSPSSSSSSSSLSPVSSVQALAAPTPSGRHSSDASASLPTEPLSQQRSAAATGRHGDQNAQMPLALWPPPQQHSSSPIMSSSHVQVLSRL